MKTYKLITFTAIAILFSGIAYTAIHKTDNTVSLAQLINIKNINDNVLGFRPESTSKPPLNQPLSINGKSSLELFSPAAIMLTDSELNNYFFSGNAALGFENGYYAVRLQNNKRFLCPEETFSNRCERVTSFNRHGLSSFNF